MRLFAMIPLLAACQISYALDLQTRVSQEFGWQSNPHNLESAESAVLSTTDLRLRLSQGDVRLDLAGELVRAEPSTNNEERLSARLRHQFATDQLRWRNAAGGHIKQSTNVDEQGKPEVRSDIDVSNQDDRAQLALTSELLWRVASKTSVVVRADFDRRWYLHTQWQDQDTIISVTPDHFNLYAGEISLNTDIASVDLELSASVAQRRFDEQSNADQSSYRAALAGQKVFNRHWRVNGELAYRFDQEVDEPNERRFLTQVGGDYRVTPDLTISADWRTNRSQTQDNANAWQGVLDHRIRLEVEQTFDDVGGADWVLFAGAMLQDDNEDFATETLPDRRLHAGVQVSF